MIGSWSSLLCLQQSHRGVVLGAGDGPVVRGLMLGASGFCSFLSVARGIVTYAPAVEAFATSRLNRPLLMIVICGVIIIHKSQVVPVGSYPEIHGTIVSIVMVHTLNTKAGVRSTTMVPSSAHIE